MYGDSNLANSMVLQRRYRIRFCACYLVAFSFVSSRLRGAKFTTSAPSTRLTHFAFLAHLNEPHCAKFDADCIRCCKEKSECAENWHWRAQPATLLSLAYFFALPHVAKHQCSKLLLCQLSTDIPVGRQINLPISSGFSAFRRGIVKRSRQFAKMPFPPL